MSLLLVEVGWRNSGRSGSKPGGLALTPTPGGSGVGVKCQNFDTDTRCHPSLFIKFSEQVYLLINQ